MKPSANVCLRLPSLTKSNISAYTNPMVRFNNIELRNEGVTIALPALHKPRNSASQTLIVTLAKAMLNMPTFYDKNSQMTYLANAYVFPKYPSLDNMLHIYAPQTIWLLPQKLVPQKNIFANQG